MITNTHVLFSKILYENCLKDLNFKLRKYKFMYGNIKPDIFCNHLKDNHTVKDSINIVEGYSRELITSKSNIDKFSIKLGVICHYICDYFCIYHTEEYANNSIFEHISYEKKLHAKVIEMIEKKKIKTGNNLSEKDVVKFVYKMQEKYLNEKQSLITDINYALGTANAVAEGIIYYGILENGKINNFEQIS